MFNSEFNGVINALDLLNKLISELRGELSSISYPANTTMAQVIPLSPIIPTSDSEVRQQIKVIADRVCDASNEIGRILSNLDVDRDPSKVCKEKTNMDHVAQAVQPVKWTTRG